MELTRNVGVPAGKIARWQGNKVFPRRTAFKEGSLVTLRRERNEFSKKNKDFSFTCLFSNR